MPAEGKCPDCGARAAEKPGDKVGAHQVGGSGTAACPGAGKTAT